MPSPVIFSGLTAMCDTLVVMPDASKDGVTLFAKNSDRPEFESQALVVTDGARNPRGARVRTQYLEIPQAATTYRTLGFRPYWCWGYETGTNEHRVAIGNEAIYTKALLEPKTRKRRGLIGMDLVRLGLERGRTAHEAMRVMARLAERCGGWGSAVPGSSDLAGSYDNSFLIADPNEAWVLELASRTWAAKRITHGAYAISNEPSITTEYDEASDDLVRYAVGRGWWPSKEREPFNFALAYGDHEHYSRQVSHMRVMRSRELLRRRLGRIDVPWLARVLRDHYEDTFLQGPTFGANDPDFLTLCMHDAPAGFTWGNTASSTIVTLPREPEAVPTFWASLVTPCTGVYAPFFIDAPLPPEVSDVGRVGTRARAPARVPADSYDNGSPWWEFRALLDRVNVDFNARAPIARTTFDRIERSRFRRASGILSKAVALRSSGRHDEASAMLAALSRECLTESLKAASELTISMQGEA